MGNSTILLIISIIIAALLHADAEENFFLESFENKVDWTKSSVEKYTSQSVIYKDFDSNKMLVLELPSKYYGLTKQLPEPFIIKDKLVVQYEVKLTQGLECGGAYIKLLTHSKNFILDQMNDKTPFTIMFGPDKCGPSNNKVHFIFQHKHPKTGLFEEKHLDNPPQIKNDMLLHLYTLVIDEKTNEYEIFIDQESAKKGSLLTDFTPSVMPPEKIDDPNDKKPKDWVDEDKIIDLSAKKPDDWDENEPEYIEDPDAIKPTGWLDNEPKTIPDPKAEKPEDWDDEDDGEYEPLLIPNPKCENVGCGVWEKPQIKNIKYKGKWNAPLIDNPAYKGPWQAKQIANPNYFVDKHPARMESIGAIAIEVWTTSGGIAFDNIWLGHSLENANKFSNKTWAKKHLKENADEEAKKVKAEEKLRGSKLENGSYWDIAQVYFFDAYKYLTDNVWILVGIATLFFTIILRFIFKNTSSKKVEENLAQIGKTIEKSADEFGKKIEEFAEEEVEKEAESEDSGGQDNDKTDDKTRDDITQQLRQRKRAPKAE